MGLSLFFLFFRGCHFMTSQDAHTSSNDHDTCPEFMLFQHVTLLFSSNKFVIPLIPIKSVDVLCKSADVVG